VKVSASLLLLAVTAALVPLSPTVIEGWYSAGLYPRIQSAMTSATNLVPIALLDLAAVVLIVAAILTCVRRARTLGVGRALLRTGASALRCAGVAYLLFLGVWGLNYRRVPLEQKLDYERTRVTREAAISLANTAARAMNGGFAAAHARQWDRGALETPFAGAQRALGARRLAVPGLPKGSLLSLYFRRAAIDGMTDPFFLEVIVNPDVSNIERPFVLAHEWAHLAGYADESEANYVAWLTCVRGDPLAQYSGWMAAYGHAAGALPGESYGSLTPLDPGPRSDLRAMAARYATSSPIVRHAAQGVYDGYLRANRVAEGIGSYDAVLRLMLGTRMEPGWTPRQRITNH
jgi:hypothetical protein